NIAPGDSSSNLPPYVVADQGKQLGPRIFNPIQRSDGTVSPAVPWLRQGDGRFGSGRDGGRFHQGIDIPAPVGTRVHPVNFGKVEFSGWGNANEGYKVRIRHPDGSSSSYMHLDGALLPKEGARVAPWDVIGRVGTTGNVPPGGQPHLHLQVYDSHGTLLIP